MPRHVTNEYQRKWRKQKREIAEGRREQPGGAFGEFMEHVRKEAMKAGAASGVMGIYKELLKLSVGLGEVKGLSGDELATLFLEAEKELKEGGYKQG